MMGVPLKLILTASIVTVLLASIEPHSQTGSQFQNLFDSIARNNDNERDFYNKILKHEEAKEQQTFDVMKEELQIAQIRNAYKTINSYKKINPSENVVANKRETNKNNRVRISLDDDVYSITTTVKYNFTGMNNTENSWEQVEKYPKENFDIIYNKILDELSHNDTSKRMELASTDKSIDRTQSLMSCLKKAYEVFVANCYFAYVVGGMQKFRQLFLQACSAKWLDSETIKERVNHVCKDYRIGFINRKTLDVV